MKYTRLTKLGIFTLFILMMGSMVSSTTARHNDRSYDRQNDKSPHWDACVPADPPADDPPVEDPPMNTDPPADTPIGGRTLPTDIPDVPIPDDTPTDDTPTDEPTDDDNCPGKKKGWFKNKHDNHQNGRRSHSHKHTHHKNK